MVGRNDGNSLGWDGCRDGKLVGGADGDVVGMGEKVGAKLTEGVMDGRFEVVGKGDGCNDGEELGAFESVGT